MQGRAGGKANVRLGMEGWDLSYPSRPLQVSRSLRSCHVACHSFDCRFCFCFRHFSECFLNDISGDERMGLLVDLV
jgi:hypothetical protein